jgi:3-oxoacyl-[acyl-carrier protein] reductase
MSAMTAPVTESVIVTGGGSGIGLACAEEAAQRGARVAVIDVADDVATAAVRGLPGTGHVAIVADVTDAATLRTRIDGFARAGDGITGVIAAAGIVSRSTLSDIGTDEFRRVLAVNVEGVQNTISAALPHLTVHGPRASIVVLGSVAAFTGGGLMGNGAYATSKAAVIGLVRAYARELAPHGIRANLVAPAATNTPMTEALSAEDRARIESGILLGRFAEPAEIAAVVNFLLSPGAGAITGQVLHANGGVYFG